MIEQRGVDAKEAGRRLRLIFDDLQTRFHDQWDWIDAYFLVGVLEQCAGEDPDNAK